MVLGKRFSKDMSPMLPSVEEAKDAEEEEVNHFLGGIPSRPPSRPLSQLSRGSVSSKIVPRSERARFLTEEDVKQEAKDDIPTEKDQEQTVPDKLQEVASKAEDTTPEDWDTDLEIKELHLCDNKLALKGAKALSLMLLENITLQRVNLSGNEFDEPAASYFSEALMNNQKLEFMDLSHNMFGDRSGEILGAAIAENTGMLELNLSWNHFRKKGAVAIAKGLGANIFLRVLDLSYNGFGNEGAAALGDALKVNNVLEEVNISNNRVALQGAVRFALSLKENKTLRVLKMARNPIQSDGCFAILKSIQANSESSIESLDFSDIVVNKQFDDLYSVVKTNMPNLSIKLGGNSDMFKRTTVKADPMIKMKEYMKKNNLQATELFGKVDAEKSSLVTYEDFERNLMNTGIALTKEEIQQLINFLDKDKSGMIDISVFHQSLTSGM
ncbi:leucine-rich repeat-containing protein 74B isoform X3 [Ranitomeya imitator]|uniref:leucine-rich repeat-containing protein 74B isoform X3 n=1 Tax=Ranitomeya imitator TaxID=111125 RepID=UPI0037E75C7C